MAAAARAAHVEVDCRRWDGILRRIWTSFGCDELNWTATPRGKQNLATLHAFMETPYTLRAHNLYTSGTGRGLPHWSSSNVYHEDATGRPLYDYTPSLLLLVCAVFATLKAKAEECGKRKVGHPKCSLSSRCGVLRAKEGHVACRGNEPDRGA